MKINLTSSRFQFSNCTALRTATGVVPNRPNKEPGLEMYIGDGSYDDVLETQQGDSCRIEGMVFLVAVLEDGNGD